MDSELEKRGKETMKVGIAGIAGNTMLFIMKFFIALSSNSQSLLADSINSATDIFSSVMTLIGGKVSSEPSDEGHNYGHGKAEYIFSLIISIVMAYLAIKIAVEGTQSLIYKNEFSFSYLLVLICIITIVVKCCLFIYSKKIGKKSENILILANAQDHINDVWTTTAVLVGIAFGKFGIYFVDGLVAILIAMKILVEAIKIFMESYNVLLDSSMNNETLEKLKEIVKQNEAVDHVDRITSKSVGNKYIVIVKISVDGNMTVNDSHKVAGKIKADLLQEKSIYDVVVHVNPV
ncbi:MAG: cation transporter [Clostridia bacterium]|nr:cation transporter [Clostridia bacterium]